MRALGNLKAKSAIPVLTEMLYDRDKRIAREAAIALAVIERTTYNDQCADWLGTMPNPSAY